MMRASSAHVTGPVTCGATTSFAWYVAHADAEVDDAVDLLVHLVHLFAMP